MSFVTAAHDFKFEQRKPDLPKNAIQKAGRVTVLNQHTDQRKTIHSLDDAAEFLLYDWPVTPSETLAIARQACLEALMGKVDLRVARDAFVKAAKEAGILIETAI